jgi:hypothetical protein
LTKNALHYSGLDIFGQTLAISTFDQEAFQSLFEIMLAPKQIGILLSTGILVGAAILRSSCAVPPRIFLAALSVIVFALLIPDEHGPWLAPHLDRWLPFASYIALVFTLGLLTVWIGLTVLNGQLVNVGIVAASIIVLAQYVSWSFRLLDRSAAFIIGGLALIGLSIAIERKRRQLLSGMR